jgi:hypothetical protein
MQKLALIAGTLAILSIPALAGPATSDKPIVVAEESGVAVSVGDRDHDRDRNHKVVVIKHHDRDDDHHHKVVEIKHHDRDDDHGHDFH